MPARDRKCDRTGCPIRRELTAADPDTGEPRTWQSSRVSLYITLHDSTGALLRELPDPLGGTFNAAGDFDELLNAGSYALLDSIDRFGRTVLSASEMVALAHEVVALLASVPETKQVLHGRSGQAWRGLTRFQAMVELCRADESLTVEFLGD